MDSITKDQIVLDQFLWTNWKLINEDRTYAESVLNEEGLIVQEEIDFAKKHMTKMKFVINAQLQRQQKNSLLEKAYSKIREAIEDSTKNTIETWQALLQKSAPAVQFRKLESWTEDEIKDVLEDLDLVKLLEDFSSTSE